MIFRRYQPPTYATPSFLPMKSSSCRQASAAPIATVIRNVDVKDTSKTSGGPVTVFLYISRAQIFLIPMASIFTDKSIFASHLCTFVFLRSLYFSSPVVFLRRVTKALQRTQASFWTFCSVFSTCGVPNSPRNSTLDKIAGIRTEARSTRVQMRREEY